MKATLVDSATWAPGPEFEHVGNDPIPNSVRSQILSAFQPDCQENGNSPRTSTAGPDLMSIGVTAKQISEVSRRSQGDQITEGRFEAYKFDNGVGTDKQLLDQYMAKSMKNIGIETESV